MIGSIERVWARLSVSRFIPVAMLVVGVRIPSDPVRKNPGYGGVLPVPASAAVSANSAPLPDARVGRQHRDQRSARGRVLYSSETQDARSSSTRRDVRAACDRRVVHGRSAAAGPNS